MNIELVAEERFPGRERLAGRLTNRCRGPVTDKVLGRGRSGAVLEQVLRARVLNRWRAAPELHR